MKTGLLKNEKFYLVVTVVIVAAFFTTFKKVNLKLNIGSKFETTEVIDYTMVRPEQSYSGYSLEGREIDAEYEAVKAKIKAQAKPVAKAAAKAKADAKIKAVAAKKLVGAQQAVAAAKAKAQATAIAQQQAAHQNNANADQSAKSAQHLNNSYQSGAATANDAATDAKDPAASATNGENNKNKKSFAQWRAEIFAKPTKETVASFIAAFRKGEVSATEYQAMAQDLIDQSDSNLKGLGLMALRSQPSLQSLSQMVHIESQLSTDLQVYVQQGYLTYFQPQNIQYLNQALQTKDKTLVVKALGLLTANLQKIKSGDTDSFVDGRNRRESTSLNLSINNFKTLIPALTTLTSSQEPDVAGVAQQIALLIQANSTAVAGI